jgi:hypothetical protein
MIKISDFFEELHKFSAHLYQLHGAVDKNKIIAFEQRHKVVLPADYKFFLSKTNGIDFMGVTVYGIFDDTTFKSIGGSYVFEHYEAGNPMPLNLIPFSPDGAGNHYCFDSNNCTNEVCKIIFWQHDLSYDSDNPPEIVNESFAEWMKEVVIDWTLEDYDYNGNRKRQ